jgi:hypothetical protein
MSEQTWLEIGLKRCGSSTAGFSVGYDNPICPDAKVKFVIECPCRLVGVMLDHATSQQAIYD